ncbi:MAG: hypothetical protein A2660_02780 [Candidatus Doudnabacteria bacterium RIFCSPHIGHO2_01_FULL_45_18]|uniref:DUF3105 domain-containing protein n=1 Tax=Candidatus Doudnabacteria bacterium RIFCSPHIGHO2_01_FULL_45_18 TaxID=1817823 RepID=A0A1F5NQN3_9BACT|nr:MAG: hypothetical protein A2660_02780 [Candidatus Doudnabacteria bacterium RIFCSPHIGHO2_01_FULL_45_18]
MGKFKLILIYLVVVAGFVGIGFWLFEGSEKPPQDLPGTAFEIQGQEHIAEGSTDHPAYNSNPPTSGWHWPAPAAWGIYKVRQPDERLIHNLEHGGIWIAYKPDQVDQDTINRLNDFASRYAKIIVEPREMNDTRISLAAWGHMQNLESFDESAILKFIQAYYDQGPEKVR